MIWGAGNQLNITLGRADFWGRRGGRQWTTRMNYRGIRKLLEANERLRHMSQTDGLTGLDNRRHLEERLEEMFEHAARLKEPFRSIDHGDMLYDERGLPR